MFYAWGVVNVVEWGDLKEWWAWERKCDGHGFEYGDGNGVWESGYENVDMVMVEMGMKEIKRSVGSHVHRTLL